LLRGGRVGRVGDGVRSDRRLRLDGRLLAGLGRGRFLVGARALDVVLAAGAITPTGTARAAALAASALHRAETLAVRPPAASALAGSAETLGRAATAARLVLVAEPRVALGNTLEPFGHDLALVDP